MGYSRKRRSRYIYWNILLCWGIALWIALCASDGYHPNLLTIQEDWWPKINAAYKIEAENARSYPTIRTNDSWIPIWKSQTILITIMEILILPCFLTSVIYLQRYVRRKCVSSRNTYYELFRVNCNLEMPQSADITHAFRKEISLQYDINDISGFFHEKSTRTSQVTRKENLKLITQSESGFNDYIFSAVSDDSSSEQTDTDENISIKYSRIDKQYFNVNSLDLAGLMWRRNFGIVYSKMNGTKRNGSRLSQNENSNDVCLRDNKRRIISSSPAFKKFLSDLKDTQFSYPYIS